MHGRSSIREILVGVVIVAALVGLLGLVGLASAGPGFLTSRRTIDVVFRDGQGIRVGSPVRIAGIDAGRVVEVDLTEVEGFLVAKLKLSLPTKLAKKLRQDVKVTIQSSLSGQSRVNILSSGTSTTALAPGQVVQGVASTFFDPILEQVGLGPVERSHLSHTISEVRQTVDVAGPKVRQILGTVQETASGVRDSAEAIRPALESSAGSLEELAKRIAAAAPKIEAALGRLDTLTAQADGMMSENRPNIRESITSLRDLLATVQDIANKDRVKIEKLLDGLDTTRARADRVLYQADVIASNGAQIMTKGRADMERTVANVRDATDWGNKLVQKIFANPFVLSPFYKPTPEDVRVQSVYDTAQVFTKGAQELHDLVKTLDAMQTKSPTPSQQQELLKMQQQIRSVTAQLGQTSQLLADALKPAPRNARLQR